MRGKIGFCERWDIRLSEEDLKYLLCCTSVCTHATVPLRVHVFTLWAQNNINIHNVAAVLLQVPMQIVQDASVSLTWYNQAPLPHTHAPTVFCQNLPYSSALRG
jgi:hypothetical protein